MRLFRINYSQSKTIENRKTIATKISNTSLQSHHYFISITDIKNTFVICSKVPLNHKFLVMEHINWHSHSHVALDFINKMQFQCLQHNIVITPEEAAD